MPTIEELVEGALGELVGDCNECCGEERQNARAILSRLATEARLGALREARLAAGCGAAVERIELLIAATEAPRRGR